MSPQFRVTNGEGPILITDDRAQAEKTAALNPGYRVVEYRHMWDLERGARFRLAARAEPMTFERMDGMYARVFNARGELEIFITREPVEVVA